MTSNEIVLLALRMARGDRVLPRQKAALREELHGSKGALLLMSLRWRKLDLDQLMRSVDDE